jgi:two-component system, OmpR family, sensor histidine kinase BaeS
MFRRNWLDRERGEGLIILDASGNILDHNNQGRSFLRTLEKNRDKGIPIIVSKKVVGTVISASTLGILNTAQSAFLTSVNRQMILAAIIAGVFVYLFALAQTQTIIKPVKQLANAARRIAGGDFTQRIGVTSADELGEMAESFNTMAMQLENQQMLRRRATADIAHELRTPLTVLQIDLESIQDGISLPTPENIAKLETEVLHLGRLVENLRMLSLAESGELQMDMDPIQLNEILINSVERLRLKADQKGIQLTVDTPEEKISLRGSEQHISQIFLNLLSNALSYTEEGGKVVVKLARQDDQALVSVQDTGAGIPADEIPYIFERLYRAAPSQNRDKDGSGLGLSITRSLVELHGGRIWVESEPGQGSTFTLSLPVISHN